MNKTEEYSFKLTHLDLLINVVSNARQGQQIM